MFFTGTSGIFLLKKQDGSIIDMSGFFDMGIKLNDATPQKEELEKWRVMNLIELNNDKTYKKLPITWKIALLEHIKFDYRFEGDAKAFDNEIELLKNREELEIRKDIYREVFRMSLDSANDAIDYIVDWISDTKHELIKANSEIIPKSKLEIDLLNERLGYLFEIETWIKESPKFDYKMQSNISNDKFEDSDFDFMLNKDFEFEGVIMPGTSKANKRMMILNGLEIFEHLESFIKKNGKYSDKKLYVLISWITGIDSLGTIKSLMPFMRNKEHPSKNNPYNTLSLKEEVERILYNFNNPSK